MVRGDERARRAQAARGAREGDVRGAEGAAARRRNLRRVGVGVDASRDGATPSLDFVRPERAEEALRVTFRGVAPRDDSRIRGGGARRRAGCARDQYARVSVRGEARAATENNSSSRVASDGARTSAASRRGRARAGAVASCARRAARARVARRETRLETRQARLIQSRVRRLGSVGARAEVRRDARGARRAKQSAPRVQRRVRGVGASRGTAYGRKRGGARCRRGSESRGGA